MSKPLKILLFKGGNMVRRIISVLLIVTIISGFVLNGKKVRAADIDYSNVTLAQLSAMKNDPDELANVHGVSATEMKCDKKIEEAVMLITKCPNIEHIYICVDGLRLDKEFFNNLSSSKYITISLQWGTVDLSGVKNSDIKSLYLTENTVEHYEEVVNLENLESLVLDSITGFCQTDYRKLERLDYLGLTAQRIDDYKEFFEKCGDIEELSLHCCNMRNSDTRYLTAYLKDIENLDLYGTYVDDISFLKDLPYLRFINLPTGVEDLSVLYELKDVECVSFDCYTELFVDDKLVDFWKENNIDYTKYEKDTRGKVDGIIASLNIPDNATDMEKIEKVTEYVLLNMTCGYADTSEFVGTTLDECLIYKTGVCHEYASFEYTLLKCVGVDAYLIHGYALDAYQSPPGAHAWVEVCVDGTWYGIEPMWIDSEDEDPTTKKYKENSWSPFYMRPTKVDDWNAWPENGDFSKCLEKYFAMYHRTMNDPMDTLPQGRNTAVPEYEKYTVTFKNEDGSELQSGEVSFGDKPSYTGVQPVKAETEQYEYVFEGWTDGTETYSASDKLPIAMNNAVYTAKFSQVEKKVEAPVVEEVEPQTAKISPVIFIGAAVVLLAGAGTVAVVLIRRNKKKVS